MEKMDITAVPYFIFLELIKQKYKLYIESLEPSEVVNGEEYIELHHGTSGSSLPNILKHGLIPNYNEQNRWMGNDVPPMKNVVYLTNRWQHLFANEAYAYRGEKKNPLFQMIVMGHLSGAKPFTHQTEEFPLYITVRVPKSKLVADEDFFLSRWMNNHLGKVMEQLGLDYDLLMDNKQTIPGNFFKLLGFEDHRFLAEACLDFNGTVAHLGTIEPKDIVSVTSLASLEWLKYTTIEENHPYHQSYIEWQRGNGKGAMKPKDIRRLETGLALDATIPITPDVKGLVADYKKKKIIVKY